MGMTLMTLMTMFSLPFLCIPNIFCLFPTDFIGGSQLGAKVRIESIPNSIPNTFCMFFTYCLRIGSKSIEK